MGLKDRIQNAWNAFKNYDKNNDYTKMDYGSSYGYRPDRVVLSGVNGRSIMAPLLNRIAMDVAAISIEHVRIDENDRYTETIQSDLNSALTLEANKDQTGRSFRQDLVLSLFDEGCIAVVPVDVSEDPYDTESFKIYTLRVGKITQWYPDHVAIRLYNDRTGMKEELIFPKSFVGIIENPLYAVMNAPNSTLQRLIRKLNILDRIDDRTGTNKLDMVIQFPYLVKSEQRQNLAKKRLKDLEEQMESSPLGIGYIDGTEHVIQLNRPIENNLAAQVDSLTELLYNQLGITKAIFDGTADEQALLNYNNRTIEPILSAICDEFTRKFLTKTARTQGQRIMYLQDPFKLVPVNNIAELADKFTRNEILSSNEVRAIIGMKPSTDPEADELRNKNLNKSTEEIDYQNVDKEQIENDPRMNTSLDEIGGG